MSSKLYESSFKLVPQTPMKKFKSDQSGFIIADFLFSFVLVISCGILVFAFTFSLATVEIAQYIAWSTARNYSTANIDPNTARLNAERKFQNLANKFPLLSGSGPSPWFSMSAPVIGDLAKIDTDLISVLQGDKFNKDSSGQMRHPWIGVKTNLELKLLSGLKIPFMGPIAPDKSLFTFPIRAFVLRHPSQKECYSFFSKEKRYDQGISKLNDGSAEGSRFPADGSPMHDPTKYVPIEDNGC